LIRVPKLLSILLLCFLLLVQPGICSAMYQISETELTQLDSNLIQLQNLNSQLLTDLELSKTDLQTARQKLEKYQADLKTLQNQLLQLKNESTLAKTDLTTAQALLKIANESLQKYEQEVKSEKTRLTWQRNLFAGLALYLAVK